MVGTGNVVKLVGLFSLLIRFSHLFVMVFLNETFSTNHCINIPTVIRICKQYARYKLRHMKLDLQTLIWRVQLFYQLNFEQVAD